MISEAARLRRKLIEEAPGVFEEFQAPGKKKVQWIRSNGVYRKMVTASMDGPLTNSYLAVFGAKLGMALYREHVGAALPLEGGVQLQCFLNAGLAQKTAEAILQRMPMQATLEQGRFRVQEQFAYRYNCDGKSILAALVGFNSNLHIFLVATSTPDFYQFPIQQPHFYFIRPDSFKSLIQELKKRPKEH